MILRDLSGDAEQLHGGLMREHDAGASLDRPLDPDALLYKRPVCASESFPSAETAYA